MNYASFDKMSQSTSTGIFSHRPALLAVYVSAVGAAHVDGGNARRSVGTRSRREFCRRPRSREAIRRRTSRPREAPRDDKTPLTVFSSSWSDFRRGGPPGSGAAGRTTARAQQRALDVLFEDNWIALPCDASEAVPSPSSSRARLILLFNSVDNLVAARFALRRRFVQLTLKQCTHKETRDCSTV